jgi:peptidoglycan/xylan/chitin deacetylase (PgdA/CDA1 family)
LIVFPVCSSQERDDQGYCAWGYAEDRGWPELERQLAWYVQEARYVVVGAHDGLTGNPAHHPPAEVLNRAIPFLRSHGFELCTLTKVGRRWSAEEGQVNE